MKTDMSSPGRRIIPFERRSPERPLRSPFLRRDDRPARTLDRRQLEHRRRMLDHLQSRSAAS